GATPEVPAEVESTALAGLLLAYVTRHVAPANSNAQVQRAVTFAAGEVFTREESGAHDVAEADRELGCIGRFAPQAEFRVEAFILHAWAASRAVSPVGDFVVAEADLQPVQRMLQDVA